VASPANIADSNNSVKHPLKNCRFPLQEKATPTNPTVPPNRIKRAAIQCSGGKNNSKLNTPPHTAPNNNRHPFGESRVNRAVADNNKKSTHTFKMNNTSM
jgi:hypothetical protein